MRPTLGTEIAAHAAAPGRERRHGRTVDPPTAAGSALGQGAVSPPRTSEAPAGLTSWYSLYTFMYTFADRGGLAGCVGGTQRLRWPGTGGGAEAVRHLARELRMCTDSWGRSLCSWGTGSAARAAATRGGGSRRPEGCGGGDVGRGANQWVRPHRPVRGVWPATAAIDRVHPRLCVA